jgi:hypothetical protein
MSPAQAVDAQQGGDASAPLSDESTLAQATHCYVRSLQTCDYSFLSADKHLAPELAAFGRAIAYPPTAHRTSVLMEVMPETTEETPKGARWAPKLQMS